MLQKEHICPPAEGGKWSWGSPAESGSGSELSQGMLRAQLGELSGSAALLGAAQLEVLCRAGAQELAPGRGMLEVTSPPALDPSSFRSVLALLRA